MNRITVGLSKPKHWFSLFKKPDIFIEVPVARNVCISYYLLQVTSEGTSIRLANRFYNENKIIFSKALAISHKKEMALVDWGKTQGEKHTIKTLGSEVFGKIIGLRMNSYNKHLNTDNPYNIIRILQGIGKGKVKYSCLNALKN
jgi:hypothetical protein